MPGGYTLESFPIQWIVIGLLIALVIFDCMRSGARRSAALSLAVPLALLLSTLLSSASLIGPITAQVHTSTEQGILFLIVFAISFFIVYRLIPSDFGSGVSPLSAVFVALAVVVVLIVAWTFDSALSSLWLPNSLIQSLFAPAYRFWWLLGAYVVLFVSGA